jgi:hypothetical protein
MGHAKTPMSGEWVGSRCRLIRRRERCGTGTIELGEMRLRGVDEFIDDTKRFTSWSIECGISQGSKMTDDGQVVPLSWRVCLAALGSAWWGACLSTQRKRGNPLDTYRSHSDGTRIETQRTVEAQLRITYTTLERGGFLRLTPFPDSFQRLSLYSFPLKRQVAATAPRFQCRDILNRVVAGTAVG